MTCRILPRLPIPELPLPFTIALPSLPPVDFDAGFCCQFIDLHLPPIPIPIPPLVINPAVIATLRGALATVQAYLDELQLECPLE